jgi:hypothetical protein
MPPTEFRSRINLSYFDLGVTQTANIGPTTAGAGAGKVTLQPLVVPTSFAPFQSLFNASATGATFDGCTLTTKNSTGERIEFTLKPVAPYKWTLSLDRQHLRLPQQRIRRSILSPYWYLRVRRGR